MTKMTDNLQFFGSHCIYLENFPLDIWNNSFKVRYFIFTRHLVVQVIVGLSVSLSKLFIIGLSVSFLTKGLFTFHNLFIVTFLFS